LKEHSSLAQILIFLEVNDIGKEIGAAAIEVVLGIITGLLFGVIISYIPSQRARYKVRKKSFLIGLSV